jgi:hypothetical protein
LAKRDGIESTFGCQRPNHDATLMEALFMGLAFLLSDCVGSRLSCGFRADFCTAYGPSD